MEATQKRMKKAVDEMIDEIDRKYLRDVQKKMFLCSSKCCDDKTLSREDVESCVDRCNTTMKGAQTTLERELGELQGQLSRCAMTCYDRLVQKYGPDPNKYGDAQMMSFNEQLEKCVSGCADDHIKLLPKIKQRFADSLH
uniref:Protein FAM136A n=2 Tax=Ascaris TaxID=6251 RepID=A0A0M3IQB9_ASCLU